MKKIETIIEPNEHILGIQRRFLKEIQETLQDVHVEAIGGMAVPMIGRSELDILVISQDISRDTDRLVETGFEHRGIDKEVSYLKQEVEGVDVTVQIMLEGNKMIGVHRQIILLLRRDNALRQRYEEYKRNLSGLERYEYRKKKVEWLKNHILPSLS